MLTFQKNSFNSLVCLNCPSQSYMILQKPHDQRKSFYSLYACVHDRTRTCLRPRTNTLTSQRALDWEPADSAVNAHHSAFCVCVCVYMSTIRLMFINTFCCVEWNCSEPWHSTAYFWGLNVHAWVCVLAWPTGTTELSLHSKAPSATVSDWWLSKLLVAAGGTSYKKKNPSKTWPHQKSSQFFKTTQINKNVWFCMYYGSPTYFKHFVWQKSQVSWEPWRTL